MEILKTYPLYEYKNHNTKMNIIIQTYNRSFRTFGSEIHKTKFCECIMILFLLFIPFIGKSEMVCLSLAGCKIEIETGECKTCVHKENLLIEDYTGEQMKKQIKVKKTTPEKSMLKKMPKLVPNKKPEKQKKKRSKFWVGTLWKCVVGCWEGVGYWDDGGNCYDKNVKLIEDKSVRC